MKRLLLALPLMVAAVACAPAPAPAEPTPAVVETPAPAPVAEHKPVNLMILYSLKAGVTPADFEAWVKSTDYPGMRGLGSVADFRTHRAEKLLMGDGKPTVHSSNAAANPMVGMTDTTDSERPMASAISHSTPLTAKPTPSVMPAVRSTSGRACCGLRATKNSRPCCSPRAPNVTIAR
jgi:hypothetical protein